MLTRSSLQPSRHSLSFPFSTSLVLRRTLYPPPSPFRLSFAPAGSLDPSFLAQRWPFSTWTSLAFSTVLALLPLPQRPPCPSFRSLSLSLSLSLCPLIGARPARVAVPRSAGAGRAGAGPAWLAPSRAGAAARARPCPRFRPGVVERGGRGGLGRQADGRTRAARGCWARAVVLRTRARASAPLASLGRVCATRRASVTATRAHRAHRGPAPRARHGGGGWGRRRL
jgi:hypothetical protein